MHHPCSEKLLRIHRRITTSNNITFQKTDDSYNSQIFIAKDAQINILIGMSKDLNIKKTPNFQTIWN